MRIEIDDLTVYFPYEFIYKEQYEYMTELYRGIKQKGHCLLEMPCGTGKTVCLLSLITSYQLSMGDNAPKLIYCTRTVTEMEKVLAELKSLVQYRKEQLEKENSELDGTKLVALGLSARKNLCINEKVYTEYEGSRVDSLCRNLTASWVREQASAMQDAEEAGIELCDYFETFEKEGSDPKKGAILNNGVYTLKDMKILGKQLGMCPYFMARRAVEYSNIIVFNYSYMLDPKIAPLVTKSFDKNSILVFDEAHNIDNVCIEVLSVNIDNHVIRNSQQNLKRLEEIIATMKRTNAKRLTDEYQRLVSGLATAGIGQRSTTEIDYSIPVLDDKIMKEAVPGNIRKAEHFVGFLRRFIQYVSLRLKDVDKVIQEMPRTFLNALHYKTTIDARTLAFCAERLISLMNTLEIKDIHEFNAIKVITDFATLVGSYEDGFTIIIEPHDERTPTIPEPILQFSCMDASIAISKPIFDRFNTVVLTSGTLSPLDKYSKLLQFSPTVSRSLPMSLTRECICPLVLTRGSDQVAVSTKYQMRNDPAVVRNYGSLLVELSRYVPDGIICFFTSYQYMEDVVMMWNQMELLDTITQHKLVFIETPNTAETSIALTNYRRACDSGRGAVFLSIARGKVAEGVDFDGHYGRAVVMFGIPFVNTESKILKARLDYLKKNYGIQEGDFLTFDALRHASQCIGRVIRNKSDYGLMILADKRYNQPDKRNKLPEWISRRIENQNLNLSTDTLIGECRKFLKQMAQPWSAKQLLLTQKDVERIATRKKAQQDKTNGTEVEDSNSRKRKFDEVQ